MQYVSIHRIDEAIQDGIAGVRALLTEVYRKKVEELGSQAAEAWVQQMKQSLPRIVKRVG